MNDFLLIADHAGAAFLLTTLVVLTVRIWAAALGFVELPEAKTGD